uniref:Uncharacterized protein n=1 Tax=Amphimedon queenslandica TaxID=400682 RepID=A0A1X7SZA4_AMPQE
MRVILVCYLLLLVKYSQAELVSHKFDGVLCETYNQTVTSNKLIENDDWTFANNDTLCENNSSFSKGLKVSIKLQINENSHALFVLEGDAISQKVQLPQKISGYVIYINN